jgi:hypothetical protein
VSKFTGFMEASRPTKGRVTQQQKPQPVVAKISKLRAGKKTQIFQKSARFLLTMPETDLLCGKKWERVVGSRGK